MAFELPALPYAPDALEPHIDKETMEIHHGRHHKAYVDNLNKAIEGTDAANLSVEEINKNISKYSTAVRNNGGGHYNHDLFWSILSSDGGGEPSGDLAAAVNDAFGSFDELKKQLQAAGASRFGSGWIAQWKEMRSNKEPIGRPRQIYTGSTRRDYVPLKQR